MSWLWRLCLVSSALSFPSAGVADFAAVQRALDSGLPDLALSELQRLESRKDSDDPADLRAMNLLRLKASVLAGRSGEPGEIQPGDLPPTPESLFWLARSLADQGFLVQAEGLLQQAENGLDRESLSSLRLLHADILLRMREPDSALELLDPASFPDGRQFEAFRQRIELLLFLGRAEDAVREIAAMNVPKREVERQILDLLAGEAALAVGDHRQAMGYFDAARKGPAKSNSVDADAAWLGAIRARISLSLHSQALDLLIAFAERRADSPLLDHAFWLLKSLPDAVSDPRVAGLANSADPRTACLAAAAIARLLPMESALDLLEATLRHHPESDYSKDLILKRCVLLLENGNVARAGEELRKLASSRLTPAQSARLSYVEARLAHEQGDSAAALRRLLAEVERARGEEASILWQNIAILAFLTGQSETFEDAITRLSTGSAGEKAKSARLLLERGIFLSSHDPSIARLMVWRYLRAAPDDPEHYRAEIVLAEIALREDPPDAEKARDRLRRIPPDAPDPILQHRDYLLVWAADLDGNPDATVTAANAFLRRWPQSEEADEIAFKAGEVEFARGRYQSARRYFEMIYGKPDSKLREQALFQAGRASAFSLSGNGLETALTLFQQVADLNGLLRHPARQQQAAILVRRGDMEGAAAVLEDALRENPGPDAENRRSLTCQLAEILILDPAENSPRKLEALRYFNDLRQEPEAPAYWRNRASWFLGNAADSRGRAEEALKIWYQVMDSQLSQEDAPEETYWSFRCGMSAIDLLGREGRWQAAAALASRLGNSNFPQAREAAALAERIRLEKFLWQDPPRLSSDPPPPSGEASIPVPTPPSNNP